MSDPSLHADIAGLSAALQATNQNIGRIAESLEKVVDKHDLRLDKLSDRQSLQEQEIATAKGGLNFLAWLTGLIDFPTLCSILFFATKASH